jgi:hypothetical protein
MDHAVEATVRGDQPPVHALHRPPGWIRAPQVEAKQPDSLTVRHLTSHGRTAHTSLDDTTLTASRLLPDSAFPAFGLATSVHALPFQWYVSERLPTKSVRSA